MLEFVSNIFATLCYGLGFLFIYIFCPVDFGARFDFVWSFFSAIGYWIFFLLIFLRSVLIPGYPSLLWERKKFQAWYDRHHTVPIVGRAIRPCVWRAFSMMRLAIPDADDETPFRVLEIGVGLGVNFRFYPRGSYVTLIDNNPYYARFLLDGLLYHPSLRIERIISTSAESIPEIDDGSMDCVVSTYTLCAVDNVARVLQEVLRILRPGGCLVFVEPSPHLESKTTFLIQKMLSPLSKIYGGYEITRNILEDLNNAGFSDVDSGIFEPEMLETAYRRHIYGLAIK